MTAVDVVILPGTVERATRRQRRHDAQEGTSRCRECGELVPCPAWWVAEAVLVRANEQAQARRRPARGRARVRPGRLPRRRPPEAPPGGLAGAVWRYEGL